MLKNIPFILVAAFFLLFAAPPGQAVAQNGYQERYVALRLIPEKNTLLPGETLRVAIEQTITPGWHTYYLNPGDSGAEPRILWSLPGGMQAGLLGWPAPERIPYAGLVNYGYEGTVTLLQTLTAPATLPDGPLTLSAEIEILVCKDICIPETSTHSITLNDPAAASTDNTDAINAIAAALPRDDGITATWNSDGKDLILTIAHEDPAIFAAIDPASVAIFPGTWGIILNAPESRVEQSADGTLTLRHPRDERDMAEIENFSTLLTYRDRDGTAHAYIASTTPGPATSTTPAAATNIAAPQATSMQFSHALILALLGGLILNLMPCVFPVLSLKALKLIELQDKGRGIAALHGVAYTAGILLSFAAIGGALLAVKAAGGDAGWGFHLQNPAVVLSLAYLLFIIGLSLSGLFEISGSFVGTGAGLTRKGGVTGTFFTGVLATLVATPCTAPFMAGALGYAFLQPAPVALGIFLALGLGLALPYLILSLVPALARLLPKPGSWMVTFRELMAFPMYAAAAWLVWVLGIQAGGISVMWALSGMVAIAFAIWVLKHRGGGRVLRGVVIALALLAILFAAMPFLNRSLLRHDTAAAPQASLSDDHENFDPDRLAALLAGDDPVFVYMTAAWCITCKVNEKIALHQQSTRDLFDAKNVAVLRGDWTNMNPQITEFLQRYGRNGVPLYVYYGGRESGADSRPDPVILPQILTPAIVAGVVAGPK